MGQYFLGVDVGGTNVKIGVVEKAGRLVGRAMIATRVELGPEGLTSRIGGEYRALLDRSGLRREDVGGVGIGSPGPLSVPQGRIIKAGNLPGFDNFPLRDRLAQESGVPAVMENDANAACWGEFWLGAGQGVSDMAMFTLGTGVGGGLVCGGQLVRGSEGNGAELGHMMIHAGGRQCHCGQKGCLEAYASASHTAARAQEALDSGRVSAMMGQCRAKGDLTCKMVFDCAKAGDDLANEIVNGTAEALGIACVNIRHVMEPQRVVLAGGMIGAGEFLTVRVRRFYEQFMWTLKAEPMDICLAQLGGDAGLIGAAGLAIKAFG